MEDEWARVDCARKPEGYPDLTSLLAALPEDLRWRPFAYDVPRSDVAVSIALFDITGRRIAQLVDGRPAPGTHAAAWGGSELDRLSSVPYVLRMEAGGREWTAKTFFIR